MSEIDKDTVGYGRGWKTYYTEAPNELFNERCTLTPIQAMVYLYLLSCVNVKKNGGCVAWPSYPTIAKHTRISPRSVQEAIKILVSKLYIFKKNRFAEDNNNGQISNMYLINHPSVTRDFTP